MRHQSGGLVTTLAYAAVGSVTRLSHPQVDHWLIARRRSARPGEGNTIKTPTTPPNTIEHHRVPALVPDAPVLGNLAPSPVTSSACACTHGLDVRAVRRRHERDRRGRSPRSAASRARASAATPSHQRPAGVDARRASCATHHLRGRRQRSAKAPLPRRRLVVCVLS